MLLFLLLCCVKDPAAGTAPTRTGPAETNDPQPAADPVATASQARARLNVDPNDAAAHLDLAGALAELRGRAAPCEHGATLDAILDHLVLAVALDPGARARILADGRFSGLGETLRYRLLARGAGSGLPDMGTLFSGLVFHGPPAGVWGSSGRIELRADGSVGVTRREPGESGPVDVSAADGRWSAGSGPLSLELGGERQQLVIGEGGELRDASGPRWYDVPSECGA